MRIKHLLGLGAALAASLPVPAAASAAIAGGTKVMPLGDSITYGYRTGGTCPAGSAEGGYRTGLYSRLAAAGVTVDFVGGLSNGPSTLPDKDHEGHCGWRIDEVDGPGGATLAGYLAAAQPDVVLLHLGTNDMNQDDATYPAATAPGRLSTLIDHIYAARPAATVYVASLVPSTNATINNRIIAFNKALPGIVAQKVAAGHDVRYVDLHDALLTSQLIDVLHPNAVGYDAMAQGWYDALTDAAPADLVLGSGFEDQLAAGLAPAPWTTESSAPGTGSFGVDRGVGKSRTGANNGWIATSGTGWNALKQTVAVTPGGTYRLSVWLRNSQNFTGGYVGVKTTTGAVIDEVQHGAAANYTNYVVTFAAGTRSSVVLHVGYWGPGVGSWEQVDDVTLPRTA
jgi:lysophospholipase L1-like esterase